MSSARASLTLTVAMLWMLSPETAPVGSANRGKATSPTGGSEHRIPGPSDVRQTIGPDPAAGRRPGYVALADWDASPNPE